jgi:hypothetical protein
MEVLDEAEVKDARDLLEIGLTVHLRIVEVSSRPNRIGSFDKEASVPELMNTAKV